jgi:WD40 repeat protein
MSLALDYLLETRGTQRDLGAHVVALAFNTVGQAAFALGDGTIRHAAQTAEDWRTIEVLDGGILSMTRDAAPTGFVCGDDSGTFARITQDGDVTEIAAWPGKWVEHVATHGNGRDALLACSVGKKLYLFDAAGTQLKVLEHPSTVTGLAFDAKGKRIAASHYNGASLWYTQSKTDNPRILEWKGSHIGIALHPAGEALVTAMQENALHGWRLPGGDHMRMSGYPAKTESLSFTRTGKYLASSGADAVVLWPFFGGGPTGRAPLELAGGADILCTRVACHPQQDVCAAGYADGSVVVVDINTQRILPVAPAAHGAVTALGWSSDGAVLAFGTESGFAALVDFAASA